jgi:hypothetical protein
MARSCAEYHDSSVYEAENVTDETADETVCCVDPPSRTTVPGKSGAENDTTTLNGTAG